LGHGRVYTGAAENERRGVLNKEQRRESVANDDNLFFHA
jgi:hypothetical protein